MRQDEVWKGHALVQTYLSGVRGGIPFAAEQLDTMLRVIQARGTPIANLLDLGCGGGAVAATLLARYPDAAATLVDFSTPMLDAARLNLGHLPQARFILADFGVQAWVSTVQDQAPYDVIVSGYAIHHQPDRRKQEVYAEIYDLLKPGGMFVNVEHVASATAWLEQVSDTLFIDTLHEFHRRQGASKTREQVAAEFVRRPDKAANILASVEDQCAWLRSIGYQDVDCYFKAFELAVFGGRRP